MTSYKIKKGSRFTLWEERLEKPEAALKKIGALALAASQKAFRDQSYGKIKWRQRSVPNVFGIIADFSKSGTSTPPKRRFEAKPVLMDTGQLRRTIAFRLVGSHTVEVGSNLPYAAVHNFGGPVESLPITKSVQEKIAKFLKRTAKKTPLKSNLSADILERLTRPNWLNKRLKGKVPARPFVGLTPQLEDDIEKWVGIKIFVER